MSIQLNLGDHKSPVHDFLPFPLEHRSVARWARSRARQISTAVPSADVYFRSLPRGRSLRSLLADRSIWINFTLLPVLGGEVSNETYKEIALGIMAFHQGRVTVLGTLIHELAHVNGARDGSHAAEEALIHCGLGHWAEKYTGIDNPHTPYVPGLLR